MAWEEQDIRTLRSLFLKGMPIKIMATLMKKTPGAVNKALSRLGIRPVRQHKPLWMATTAEEKARIHKPRNKIKKVVSLRETPSWRALNKEACPSTHKLWVGWPEVVAYLQKCGEKISITGKGEQAMFYIGKRTCSRAQLLIRANQNRSEQQLPLYCVHAFTEY